MKKKKIKRWPIVLGSIAMLLAAAFIWMFATSHIETSNAIIPGEAGTKKVVVYFTRVGVTKTGTDAISAATPNTNSNDSSLGDTEAAAQMIAAITGADRVQIYTDRYYRDSYAGTAARAFVERYLNLRPGIVAMPDLSGYDTIYIGYPIWWFNAPMAVATFLENMELQGKTVVPFCTSQDNDIDLSMNLIRSASKGATVTEGLRLHNANEATVRTWLHDIGVIQ